MKGVCGSEEKLQSVQHPDAVTALAQRHRIFQAVQAATVHNPSNEIRESSKQRIQAGVQLLQEKETVLIQRAKGGPRHNCKIGGWRHSLTPAAAAPSSPPAARGSAPVQPQPRCPAGPAPTPPPGRRQHPADGGRGSASSTTPWAAAAHQPLAASTLGRGSALGPINRGLSRCTTVGFPP